MKPRVRSPRLRVKIFVRSVRVALDAGQMLNQYEILAMMVLPGSVRKG